MVFKSTWTDVNFWTYRKTVPAVLIFASPTYPLYCFLRHQSPDNTVTITAVILFIFTIFFRLSHFLLRVLLDANILFSSGLRTAVQHLAQGELNMWTEGGVGLKCQPHDQQMTRFTTWATTTLLYSILILKIFYPRGNTDFNPNPNTTSSTAHDNFKTNRQTGEQANSGNNLTWVYTHMRVRTHTHTPQLSTITWHNISYGLRMNRKLRYSEQKRRFLYSLHLSCHCVIVAVCRNCKETNKQNQHSAFSTEMRKMSIH